MKEETKFSVMASLFEWIQKSRSAAKKRSKFRKFLDIFCDPMNYFSSIRLILPVLDRERGSYGLKESVLAVALVDALAMSRDSPDAVRLLNWRKGAGASNAGNFPLVAAEVLQRRQPMASPGLTIHELNQLLDRLASSENRGEKVSVLSTLINKTNTREMKWIIMIILKDLKMGISEKVIFNEFHPDAQDLFNVTCDLKLVCEKLRDPTQRHKRQDIEVGKAVRPQLAMRVSDAHAAWKKLHGKEVVVECKFDGDRIQIHKNGAEIHYFSRNFLDHSEYGPGISDIIVNNVLADRCILDGEMLVWDTSLNRFADFGSNQEIAKAAKDGLDSDRQVLFEKQLLLKVLNYQNTSLVFDVHVILMQLCYVAFDILYVGDTSVIHQSLKERHELLQKVVKPLKGRLEILLPKGGLNSHRLPGEPCWSQIAHGVDDVDRFFKETIENRDEGIVLKDLGSKWEPSDRSGKWLKLKPEYIHAGSDLDLLIIGGYYGSGRRGGEVAQFLLGLAERPDSNTYPRRFVSFCRVGTGLSDDELDAIVTKLKPFFRKYEYPKKAPPIFYQVTNSSKERPDVWIENPEKSIILSITSDIRTIRSEVFAAPYSLRFPRIDRVRYDKPWHECLDVQSFVELVHSSNGTTQRGKEYGGLPERKITHNKYSRRGEKKNVSVVPSHFIQTDVSEIKGETLIFSDMMFYFVNLPAATSLESLHKLVAENGGTFSMNLNNSVTHCIAAESKGIKYQAAKRHDDIIHYSWVLDCCAQKKLLPLLPKYFLFTSDSSKKKLQEEMDEFSDSYYWNIDLADLKQLLSNIGTSANDNTIDHFKKKCCPKNKWSYFHSCSVYFYFSTQSLTPDQESLLGLKLRRLKLEVSMGGGKISSELSRATHLVVLTLQGSDVDIDPLRKSVALGGELLHNKRLHVVRSQWLDDSLERKQKLREDVYSLKSSGWEDSSTTETYDLEREEHNSNLDGIRNEELSSFPDIDVVKKEGTPASVDSRILASPVKDVERKRTRLGSGILTKGKANAGQGQRKRARIVKKHAKICEDEADESGSFTTTDKAGAKTSEAKEDEIHKSGGSGNIEIPQSEMMEDAESSHGGKVGLDEDDRNEQPSQKAPDVEMFERHDRQGSFYEQLREKPVKVEVMVDPVHAIVMDMIPSLGTTKLETQNQIPEDQKPPVDNVAEPVKKKKVSYKNLAAQLLKD